MIVFRVKIILTSEISVFRGKFRSLSFHLDMILFIFPVYKNTFKLVESEHAGFHCYLACKNHSVVSETFHKT